MDSMLGPGGGPSALDANGLNGGQLMTESEVEPDSADSMFVEPGSSQELSLSQETVAHPFSLVGEGVDSPTTMEEASTEAMIAVEKANREFADSPEPRNAKAMKAMKAKKDLESTESQSGAGGWLKKPSPMRRLRAMKAMKTTKTTKPKEALGAAISAGKKKAAGMKTMKSPKAMKSAMKGLTAA